jgi:hypothetical protein
MSYQVAPDVSSGQELANELVDEYGTFRLLRTPKTQS